MGTAKKCSKHFYAGASQSLERKADDISDEHEGDAAPVSPNQFVAPQIVQKQEAEPGELIPDEPILLGDGETFDMLNLDDLSDDEDEPVDPAEVAQIGKEIDPKVEDLLTRSFNNLRDFYRQIVPAAKDAGMELSLERVMKMPGVAQRYFKTSKLPYLQAHK